MKINIRLKYFSKSRNSLKMPVIAALMGIFLIIIFVQFGGRPVNAEASTGNTPAPERQLAFNLAPREPIGPNSIQTRYADLDGDGFLDIVSVNGGQGSPNPTLTILFGTGDGRFGTPQVIPTYMIGHAMAIGDLNGDGKPDIAIASFYQSGIAVFLNQGNRQFSEPVFTITPEREFFDLAIADFDGDGKNDVVALEDQIDQRLRFYHFNGDNTLSLFATVAQNSGDTSYEAVMEVGDVNGDGRPDVILAGGGPFGSRAVNFVYGRTPGATLSMTFGFYVTDKAVGISVADLDNDGDNDMAIAFYDTTTPTQHSLQVFQNTGSGVFLARPQIFFEYIVATSDLTLADLNNDGKIDMAALVGDGNGGAMVLIAYGNGDCTFNLDKYYAVSASSTIYAADVNGDNKVDVMTASTFLDQTNYVEGNQVSLLINNAPLGFGAPVVKLWGPNFIDGGDFNHDGYRDMVSSWMTTYSNTSGADISINDKQGGFYEEVSYGSPAALSDMKVGDFDGDGNPDVATVHGYSSRQIAIYAGNGTGTLLKPSTTTGFPEGLTKMIAGDFNTDGKDDIFVVDAAGKAYAMLSHGNGILTVAPNSPFVVGNSLSELQKGDFNLDHKMDLIIAGKLWLGDGNGGFSQSAVTLPVLTWYVPGDFNGDGKLDIAGTKGDQIIGVLGDGNGGFPSTFSRTIPGAASYNSVQSLVTADFDLDGFDDVALLMKDNRAGNLIVVRSGGTTPSWKEPDFFGVATATRTLFPADFNGDGRPDLEWLGGNSRGVIYNTTNRGYSIPFDFDGDGKSDVGVYRPSTGDWYLLRSTEGLAAFHFGTSDDVLTPADFTGDGKTDVAVFRPSVGTWFMLRSEDNTFYGVQFGSAGDTPAPGDFDGDGKADLAVFRPGPQAYWYLQQSSAGFAAVQFGTTADLPAASDYDGDGKIDVSVYRPSLGQWFRLSSGNGSFYAVQFGAAGDMIVPSDYTGDGKTDIAVFRPSTSTWYILRSGDATFYGAPFGAPGDLPTPGDYDGDGKADLAVWRSGAQSNFYIQGSTTGFTAVPWGVAGDRPIANAYVH
jgi:FG-GAP-like repeat